jgi:hypothetical protein
MPFPFFSIGGKESNNDRKTSNSKLLPNYYWASEKKNKRTKKCFNIFPRTICVPPSRQPAGRPTAAEVPFGVEKQTHKVVAAQPAAAAGSGGKFS